MRRPYAPDRGDHRSRRRSSHPGARGVADRSPQPLEVARPAVTRSLRGTAKSPPEARSCRVSTRPVVRSALRRETDEPAHAIPPELHPPLSRTGPAADLHVRTPSLTVRVPQKPDLTRPTEVQLTKRNHRGSSTDPAQNRYCSYITEMGRAIGHYARFVPRGSVRVDATSDDPLLRITAFRVDAAGRLALVVINNANASRTVTVALAGIGLARPRLSPAPASSRRRLRTGDRSRRSRPRRAATRLPCRL